MRLLITAAAAAFALGLGACTQGTNEEAGEQADESKEGATGVGDTQQPATPPPATTP